MMSWWTATSKFWIVADTEVAANQIEYAVPDQIEYLSLLKTTPQPRALSCDAGLTIVLNLESCLALTSCQ